MSLLVGIGRLQVPAGMVGVPDMMPDAGSTATPGGRFVALHVYGAEPPEACNEPENAVPIVPAGSDVVVMVGGGALAEYNVRVLESVCPIPSSIWTVNVDVAEALGVPEITPVEGSSTRPDGRAPLVTLHVYGGTATVCRPVLSEYCRVAV